MPVLAGSSRYASRATMLVRLGISLGLAFILSGAFPAQAAREHASDSFRAVELLKYDIDEQPLAQALTVFARQADVQILYRTRLVPPLVVPSLHGYFTRRQALEQLLHSTGLAYTFGGNRALVIHLPDTVAGIPQQPSRAGGEAPAANAGEHLVEEIYVTGIRRTLKLNLAIKQNSDMLLDVITSEDIGKFPDQNVADALQRIAGVSVDRLWGEGRDVNIRGTDKDINRTLLNGQHVASAYWWANDNPSRGFNYSTLASQLVQSLEVHKSPAADIDEGSIGGTVIIRTRKPFNLKAFETHAAYEQHYSDLSQAWGPQASLLSSWKNRQQSFGVLASLNWQDTSTRRDGLETFPANRLYNVTDTQGITTGNVYAIWGGGSAILQQDRTHTTGNVTLQWSPAERWEMVLNAVRSNMDIDNRNHNFLFVPGGYKLREQPPARVENPRYVTADDGNRILVAGTLTNADTTGAVLDSMERQAYVDTVVNDLDINYRGRDWQLHVQLGETSAAGGTGHDWMYRFLGDTRSRFALRRNAIDVEYLDINPRDAGDMSEFSSESRDWIRRMENAETYGQIDLTREVDGNFISALKIGSKHRDHRIENHRTVGTIDETHPAWPQLQQIGLAEVSSGLTPELNQQSATPQSLAQYAWTDAQRLDAIIQPFYDAGVMRYHYDRAAFYRIEEDSWAHYLMMELEGGRWSGNAGVRGVSTRQTASVFQGSQLTSAENRYHDYLPSVNVSYRLQPNLYLRGAAAQVLARPNFQNLSPNIVIDATNGAGSAGNPHLDPYRADQLDLGIEWYFAEASLLSATAFHKEISTFVFPEASLEMVDGQEIILTRPRNAPGADIAGLEFQWQQDFANGVGLLSNYTYTDATVPSPDGLRTLELPGNSKSQFNASVYYEDSRMSGRLSYNYRSGSYGDLIAGSQTETAAYEQWDASLQWRFNDIISLSLKAINLGDEVIYIRSANDVPRGFYENGRRFIVGLRMDY